MSNYLLRDHKTGFKLTSKIVEEIASHVAITRRTFFAFWDTHNFEDRFIVAVRNPREIIISGYFYHLKCQEKWAIQENGYYYDYWADVHFTEQALRENQHLLDFAKTFSTPIPYQQKLASLSEEDGIIFEMNHIAKLTIDGMAKLSFLQEKNVHVLKLEDLIFKHDETVKNICYFLNVAKVHHDEIVKRALKHNLLHKQKESTLPAHATNTKVVEDRYKQHWSERIEKEYQNIFPDDPALLFGYAQP